MEPCLTPHSTWSVCSSLSSMHVVFFQYTFEIILTSLSSRLAFVKILSFKFGINESKLGCLIFVVTTLHILLLRMISRKTFKMWLILHTFCSWYLWMNNEFRSELFFWNDSCIEDIYVPDYFVFIWKLQNSIWIFSSSNAVFT